MKRIITITAIISVVLFSCEKANEENMQDELQNQKSSVQSEMSELEISINNFLEKMESEEEGSLPLDSAVYFLEAGFNYRYAHAGNDSELAATLLDTSYVGLTISEDEFCEFTDLFITYENIYDKMDVIFEGIEYESKALHVVDAELVEMENESKLRLISSWKYLRIGSFDFFDGDWWWGNDRGRCDHTDQPLDAKDAIIFKYKMSHLRPFGIWTNVEARTQIFHYDAPLPTGQSNPFGYGDYYLYANGDDCLKENEIDYYAQALEDAIDIAKTDHPYDPPTNKATQDVILLDPLIVGKGNWHRLKVVVGDFQEQRIGLADQDFYQM